MAQDGEIRYIRGRVIKPSIKIVNGVQKWNCQLEVPWSKFGTPLQFEGDAFDRLVEGQEIEVLLVRGRVRNEQDGSRDYHFYWDLHKLFPTEDEKAYYSSQGQGQSQGQAQGQGRQNGNGNGNAPSSAPSQQQPQQPQQQHNQSQSQSQPPASASPPPEASQLPYDPAWVAALEMASRQQLPYFDPDNDETVLIFAHHTQKMARVFHKLILYGPDKDLGGKPRGRKPPQRQSSQPDAPPPDDEPAREERQGADAGDLFGVGAGAGNWGDGSVPWNR